MSGTELISRQAAIDMIRLYREDETVDLDELESSIAMLPSEQPKAQLSTEDTTFDCISRRAAIDAVSKYLEPYAIGETIKTLLWILPSAQPVRKGKWIYGENNGQDGWYCSECGFFVPWDYDYYGLDNIDFIKEFVACPHCEAKMESYTGKPTEER